MTCAPVPVLPSPTSFGRLIHGLKIQNWSIAVVRSADIRHG
jgi:hypothetical protein